MDGMHQIGRLAMRQEGDNWNAYYSQNQSMDGAIYLGSIKMLFVQDPKRRAAFMGLMSECISDIIEEKTGIRPQWGGPITAPEGEKTGSAH